MKDKTFTMWRCNKCGAIGYIDATGEKCRTCGRGKYMRLSGKVSSSEEIKAIVFGREEGE